MKRVLSLALLLMTACGSEAPPEASNAGPLPPGPTGFDVWLADLSTTPEGWPSVATPVNATERPGYDNQPYFTPDGSGFWYTVNDDQSGQADIWRYDIGSAGVTQVTQTAPESEYSATPLADGSGISIIRVEADSLQRLWRIDPDGGNGAVILPDLAPVGYHKWVDETTLVMFVLGDRAEGTPSTLRIGHTDTGEVTTLAERIGRSIQRIPSGGISFVQQGEEDASTVMRLDPGTGAIEELVATVGNGDHTWTPAGVMLMGDGSKLMGWTPGQGAEWREVADFSDIGFTVSRLAVSPDGTHIAIVGDFSLN